jgi:phosphatidylserine decarboxylase
MIAFLTFILLTTLFAALAWKWELDRKIAFPWAFLMGLIGALAVALIGPDRRPLLSVLIAGGGTAVLSFIAVLVLFFRNPERTPPKHGGIIVSPADGIVKYVQEIRQDEFPLAQKGQKEIPLREFIGSDVLSTGGIQIGIGMSLLDVHINRSPIRGTVSELRRIPGAFHSLKKMTSLLENERVAVVVDGAGLKIGFVLIASRLVRRICTSIVEGQTVELGQRIGMIRFGSQVDVLIPAKSTPVIKVQAGDKVKAGESVLAVVS